MHNGINNTPQNLPRDLTWLVIIFFTVVGVLFIHSRSYSTNETSRLASIESLIHRRTWIIDESPFSHTLDKLKISDHFYSTKPPTLSFVGAGIYAVLHHGFDLTVAPGACAPDRNPTFCRAVLEPEETDWVYFFLVLLMVNVPATLTLALTYRLGRRRGFSNSASFLFVLVMGLGTALFPYSTTLSNHIPSAAGLSVALYILLTRPNPEPHFLALAGFSATLAATIDLSAGIYLLGIFIYVLVYCRQTAVYFILGALPPGLLAIYLNVQITGTPLPPQLYTQGYDYEGSTFLTNPGGHRTSQDVWQYIFDMLLGERGLFSFYPIVLWYLYGLIRSVTATQTHIRRLAIVIIVATMGYLMYFMFRTHSFGGFGFGTRWLINPVPLLALFAINPELYHPRSWTRTAVIVLLSIISIVSTYPGALNPWKTTYPLIRLTYDTAEPSEIIPVALSGYGSYSHVNADIRESFGVNTVPRRWFDARSSFVVPAGTAWWFIHQSTPLPPQLAKPFGLNVDVEYALNADLSPLAWEWIETFSTEAYQSPDLIPASQDDLQVMTLPASFADDGDTMRLLGYVLQQSETELTFITAWQIETRTFPTGERKVFVHLLAADGSIAAQNDSFAAKYDTLFPGDLYFQVQTMSIQDLPTGKYWLQTGVYDPNTNSRLKTNGQERLLLQQIEISQPQSLLPE